MCSGGGVNPTATIKVVMLLAWISVHDHVDGGKLRGNRMFQKGSTWNPGFTLVMGPEECGQNRQVEKL